MELLTYINNNLTKTYHKTNISNLLDRRIEQFEDGANYSFVLGYEIFDMFIKEQNPYFSTDSIQYATYKGYRVYKGSEPKKIITVKR